MAMQCMSNCKRSIKLKCQRLVGVAVVAELVNEFMFKIMPFPRKV